MAYIQTEDPRVARETTTGGLVATNIADLSKHRTSRNMTKRLIQHRQASDMKSQALEARLDQCESLLSELSRHMSSLTTQSIPECRRSEA